MIQIVDTSVVLKWFVAEEGQAAAERLIGQPLAAPDLLVVELSNAMWRKWRQSEMSQDQINVALSQVRSFVDLVPTLPLVEAAVDIALELDHPVYDCIFLALAGTTNAPLLTADQRLIARCRDTQLAPSVQPLVP